jgi:D-glycero-D-manno-heptose 1,7-bisphosphate phosphatase
LTHKALFLDRDGVINSDSGYVHTIEDFHFIDGIFELCQKAISSGYLIIIVTNQAGIGRGLYTLEDFNILTQWMCQTFLVNNVIITEVYYSPFHPTCGIGKYKKDHETRKPKPGMILNAANKYNLNLKDSVLIGDSLTDIKAGQSAGIEKNIFFNQNNKSSFRKYLNCHFIENLEEAKCLL